MNNSPPDSSVYEISQARILEWVAISYSKGSSQPRDQTCVSFMGRWGLYHWAAWKATEPRARISFLLGGGGRGGGTLHGMWNLSSLTRGWTHTLCSGSVETTTEPPRKSNSEDGFQSRPGHSHGQSLDLPNDMGQLLSFFLKWVWIELIHLDSCTFPVRPEITECPSSDAALQYGVECSGPSVSGVPLESTATW